MHLEMIGESPTSLRVDENRAADNLRPLREGQGPPSRRGYSPTSGTSISPSNRNTGRTCPTLRKSNAPTRTPLDAMNRRGICRCTSSREHQPNLFQSVLAVALRRPPPLDEPRVPLPGTRISFISIASLMGFRRFFTSDVATLPASMRSFCLLMNERTSLLARALSLRSASAIRLIPASTSFEVISAAKSGPGLWWILFGSTKPPCSRNHLASRL